MNNTQSKPMTYNDLPSFFKQKLWNNKSLTFTITRDSTEDNQIEVTLIKNERNNTTSPN
jgi:hypothetical protein